MENPLRLIVMLFADTRISGAVVSETGDVGDEDVAARFRNSLGAGVGLLHPLLSVGRAPAKRRKPRLPDLVRDALYETVI